MISSRTPCLITSPNPNFMKIGECNTIQCMCMYVCTCIIMYVCICMHPLKEHLQYASCAEEPSTTYCLPVHRIEPCWVPCKIFWTGTQVDCDHSIALLVRVNVESNRKTYTLVSPCCHQKFSNYFPRACASTVYFFSPTKFTLEPTLSLAFSPSGVSFSPSGISFWPTFWPCACSQPNSKAIPKC